MTEKHTRNTSCPECGCPEFKEAYDKERECISCHQSWYEDVDYRHVTAARLAILTSDLRLAREEADAARELLRGENCNAGVAVMILNDKPARDRWMNAARARDFAIENKGRQESPDE